MWRGSRTRGSGEALPVIAAALPFLLAAPAVGAPSGTSPVRR
ncbi:MAG TPA: hypothetical protein VHN80_16280 [Kineosporiaceae bacterium]|nr:hypothetical protein [Kineosporiaceae bacterium]